MTKSKNTKNEQHCIKQNEKSFIQKDLSLTELWQKGKLPCGWYWVEGRRVEGIYAYTAEYLNNMYRPRNSERIIEQVPSYDEWQAKLKENKLLKKFYALEVVKENEQLKEELSRESYKVSEAYCFVEELKELLKECRDVLQQNILSVEEYKLLAKIDEVLK